MTGSLTLWIAFPRIAGGDFPLRPGRHIVGRANECDLVVSHPTVSRRHAQITVLEAVKSASAHPADTSSVTVLDLESRNGTFVDGKRVDNSEVRRGQWLEFGGVRFLLETSDFHPGSAVEEEMDLDSPTELADSVDKPLFTTATLDVSRSTQTLSLSKAQTRVYQLLLGGLSNKQIASRLALSQHTVHNHLRAIYR